MIKRLFSALTLWLLFCPPLHAAEALATFAGGCFWCVEAGFEQVPGVTAAISGYTGGKLENPTYKQVARGGTGHLESVQVHYDPSRITYEGLLEVFWRMINPTDPDGQFYDRGMQYSTAIFYHDEEQRRIAEASKKRLDATERYVHPVITPIRPLEKFWRAEESHQDYYLKNSFRYTFFRWNSGRDHYLEQIWGDDLALDYGKFVPKGAARQAATQAAPPNAAPPAGPQGRPNDAWQKPDEAELRRRLTPLQYDVTQDEGTEPPFKNEYWDEKREGIYVDRVSGEPLFSSLDKYDSGTGWPSFTRPLAPENIVEESDFRLLLPRTEIRSRIGQSHLGHLFDDGPKPTGLRYCMNSAALRFIPKEKLAEEGYGDYLKLFAK